MIAVEALRLAAQEAAAASLSTPLVVIVRVIGAGFQVEARYSSGGPVRSVSRTCAFDIVEADDQALVRLVRDCVGRAQANLAVGGAL